MQVKWKGQQQGFSLIELMIVVVIIGIIAAFAYPTYTNQVESTRRGNAQADLMELAQWMERRYSANYSYAADSGGSPELPFNTSPRNATGNGVFYNLEVDEVTDNTYTLSATPNGVQSDDRCGTLTLDNRGERDADGDDCW